MSNFKLDIFDVLKKLDGKNFRFSSYTDEEKDSLSPLIIQRWMSTGSNDQTLMINSLSNKTVFQLGKHKELQMMLLNSCGTGRSRFSWIKMSKRKVEARLKLDVIKRFYNYSTREAEMIHHLISTDEIFDMAEHVGYQPDEMKLLKKELG